MHFSVVLSVALRLLWLLDAGFELLLNVIIYLIFTSVCCGFHGDRITVKSKVFGKLLQSMKRHATKSLYNSPRNSPRKSAIADRIAEVNSICTVITSAKILPRWLFPSKMYIRITIFNSYFSTKLSFTNKGYHLHVLEKCLYVLQEVRSIIYLWQFTHPLSLRSRDNGISFAFTSYIIVPAKFCNVTFLNNFFFSFFYHLVICRLQRKIRKTKVNKSYLHRLFF